MLQYVIIAKDGEDDEALERRMTARPAHFAGAKILKQNNRFIAGGATLDAEGKMIGSVMIVQFETEAEFRHWYTNEPYIKGHVWKSIEVKPFRLAEV
ncbi:MAG: hypothetical protein H7Y27_03940 [Gemmatimonadaceae bacterium]|nr:hypothetical protein [Chitinophagaceae bacterium]